MFWAHRTPLMLYQGASTFPVTFCLDTSLSPLRSGPSSLTFDPKLGQMQRECWSPPSQGSWSSANPSKPSCVTPPIPLTIPLPNKQSALYPPNLTPIPSASHPHCLTKGRLRLWLPTHPPPPAQGHSTLREAEHEQTKDTMIHAWEEDTYTAYGAGLFMWHCFAEQDRLPATQALLSAFVAHMAAAYSRRTISNYLNGVWAWHLLHGIPWALERREMDTMLWADKLTPSTSRKKKRLLYTPSFISAIWQHLNLEDPLDTAVFTYLTTCFYALAHLGKFMVLYPRELQLQCPYNPPQPSYDQDWNNLKVTVLHLLRIKAVGSQGKDVYWISQNKNYLHINQPPWKCTPFCILCQATPEAPPHQCKIPGEGSRCSQHGRPWATAGSWHQDQVNAWIPPPGYAFWCDESQVLGKQLLPPVPVETCCHHCPLHPGVPYLAQGFYSVHHAPSVLASFYLYQCKYPSFIR